MKSIKSKPSVVTKTYRTKTKTKRRVSADPNVDTDADSNSNTDANADADTDADSDRCGVSSSVMLQIRVRYSRAQTDAADGVGGSGADGGVDNGGASAWAYMAVATADLAPHIHTSANDGAQYARAETLLASNSATTNEGGGAEGEADGKAALATLPWKVYHTYAATHDLPLRKAFEATPKTTTALEVPLKSPADATGTVVASHSGTVCELPAQITHNRVNHEAFKEWGQHMLRACRKQKTVHVRPNTEANNSDVRGGGAEGGLEDAWCMLELLTATVTNANANANMNTNANDNLGKSRARGGAIMLWDADASASIAAAAGEAGGVGPLSFRVTGGRSWGGGGVASDGEGSGTESDQGSEEDEESGAGGGGFKLHGGGAARDGGGGGDDEWIGRPGESWHFLCVGNMTMQHSGAMHEAGSAQSAMLFVPVVIKRANGGAWGVSLRPGCSPFFNPTLTTRYPPPHNRAEGGWARCPLTTWAEALNLNVPSSSTSTDCGRLTRAARASRRGGRNTMSVYPSCHLVSKRTNIQRGARFTVLGPIRFDQQLSFP